MRAPRSGSSDPDIDKAQAESNQVGPPAGVYSLSTNWATSFSSSSAVIERLCAEEAVPELSNAGGMALSVVLDRGGPPAGW
jgi:hypothetical protein